MKVVIVGGSGLIGRKLAARLQQAGHAVVIAAPSHGVDTLTGRGVAAALAGADALVDVSNSPSFEAQAVMRFFETSTRRLVDAAAAAGVRHHVALSVVGTDRAPDNGYFRAKLVQERLIAAGAVPYTIVRATQFHEFVGAIADAATVDGSVHASPAALQPIAADDVARALAETLEAPPRNGLREIAGPERSGIDVLLRRFLAARGDARPVVTDPAARYFGGTLDDDTLVPADGAWLGRITLDGWLAAQPAA